MKQSVSESESEALRPQFLPQLSTRAWLLVAVVIAYAILTWGVLARSPFLTLDTHAYNVGLDIRTAHRDWFHWLNTYAMLGQRAPAALAALPWVLWQAYRRRSAYPIILMGSALLVLNLSVGVVKIWIGRVGPRHTTDTYRIFHGGDIYPSGHVSNAVVLFGILAMMSMNHKRLLTWVAVFVAVSVGLVTVYLQTHWLTDVVGGWLAGALVLLVLPPIVSRLEVVGHHAIGRWLHLEPPERVLAAAGSGGSEETDPGEVLGEQPEPGGKRLVPSGGGRSDGFRVSAQLAEPVRSVVPAADGVWRRRRVERRERAHVGALSNQTIPERHNSVLD